MNIIAKYRELPEASLIPDEAWTCQAIEDKMSRLRNELAETEREYEQARKELLTVLFRSWTRQELIASGWFHQTS